MKVLAAYPNNPGPKTRVGVEGTLLKLSSDLHVSAGAHAHSHRHYFFFFFFMLRMKSFRLLELFILNTFGKEFQYIPVFMCVRYLV